MLFLGINGKRSVWRQYQKEDVYVYVSNVSHNGMIYTGAFPRFPRGDGMVPTAWKVPQTIRHESDDIHASYAFIR